MGCMIVFLLFIILLGTGALGPILSGIWSVIVFIFENEWILIVVPAACWAISKSLEEWQPTGKRIEAESKIKNDEDIDISDMDFYDKDRAVMDIITDDKIFSFRIDYGAIPVFYKKDDLSSYNTHILSVINRLIEYDIEKNIYKLYIDFYRLGKYDEHEFDEYLKKYGYAFGENRKNHLESVVIEDKLFLVPLIDSAVEKCRDKLEKLRAVLDAHLKKEFYDVDVVDLDTLDEPESFYDSDLVYTSNYLKSKVIPLKNGIYATYDGLIRQAVEKHIREAGSDRDALDFEQRLDDANGIVTTVNRTLTNYLEVVSSNISKRYNSKVLAISSAMSIDELETRILEVKKEIDADGEIFENYLSGKNIPKYFKEMFKRFPAPFWAADEVDFKLNYNGRNHTLTIDAVLPSSRNVPKNISIKNIDKNGEAVYARYGERELADRYHDFIYQYMLAVVCYAFACDTDSLDKVVVNGKMKYLDTATGQYKSDYVVSIAFSRDECSSLSFVRLNARECFVRFNGITSDSFIKIRPITPLSSLKDAGRTGQSGRKDAPRGVNLATMPWRDFEFLIKELFDKAYKRKNYSLEVTQGSPDGGVDIIIHDYDPLNGGTILVQVKRYSHIVGIEAVRALYGILEDHGAMKGVLVTTAHFGREAQRFVKNKPLTLIDGEGLLKLLTDNGFSGFYINSEQK